VPDPDPGPPSPLFTQELPRLRRAARLGPVADVACGRGRHALAAARLGAPVVALDRNGAALRQLGAWARERGQLVWCVRTDLETPHGTPLKTASCGAVLVFRFLFRPLLPALVECLRPGGLLLYETFTIHQRELPHGPRNPAFLLEPGELRNCFPGLEILRWEEGWFGDPRPEALARLVARKPGDPARRSRSRATP
jgi:SAM-dependent methyltransferase